MKIGILTYHRAENYGALLQAYALLTYMQQLGHNVSFVDYWPQYHVEHYRVFSIKRMGRYNLKSKIIYILSIILYGWAKYLRKRRLQHFMKEKLCVSNEIKHQKYEE